MKFGNLNFLVPSGPLRVCNGTALPFTSRGLAQSVFVLRGTKSVDIYGILLAKTLFGSRKIRECNARSLQFLSYYRRFEI